MHNTYSDSYLGTNINKDQQKPKWSRPNLIVLDDTDGSGKGIIAYPVEFNFSEIIASSGTAHRGGMGIMNTNIIHISSGHIRTMNLGPS